MNSTIMQVGLDLAKSVFVVYGVDERGKCRVRRHMRRGEVLTFFATLSPCLVGMEAGSGAHYWARELIELGHDARIMDPRLVAPYRSQGRTGKNDSNDAAAICEAVGRPQMRFVPIKDVNQQAILIVHRVRKARVEEKNRVANQLRGLLAEFGIVIPRLQVLEEEILAYDRKVEAHVRRDARARRLCKISGIGPITASALVATIGNGRDFKNGRQLGAWLGLTPRQSSSSGRNSPGPITTRGDVYLRTLLIHGARSELKFVHRRSDPKSRWAHRLKEDKPRNKAAVALANKHARQAWAILSNEF